MALLTPLLVFISFSDLPFIKDKELKSSRSGEEW